MKYLTIVILILLVLVACAPKPVLTKKQVVVEPKVEQIQEKVQPETVKTPKTGLLMEGDFVTRAVPASGYVKLIRLPDLSYQIEFQNFEIGKIDEAIVVLTEKISVFTAQDLGTYFEVEQLKGTVARQFYFLPSSVNIDDYNSVTLLSAKNKIVYATASLFEANEEEDIVN